MKYRDANLEQALVDIANRKGDFGTRAPSVCLRAMHRITELENAWEAIRDKMQEANDVAQNPPKDD